MRWGHSKHTYSLFPDRLPHLWTVFSSPGWALPATHLFLIRSFQTSFLYSPSLETYFTKRDNQNWCGYHSPQAGSDTPAHGALGGLRQVRLVLTLWGIERPEFFYTLHNLSCPTCLPPHISPWNKHYDNLKEAPPYQNFAMKNPGRMLGNGWALFIMRWRK